MTNTTRALLTVLGITGGVLFGVSCNQSLKTAEPATTKVISSPQPPVPAQTGNTPAKQVTHLDVPADRLVMIEGPIGAGSELTVNQILRLGRSDEPLYVVLNSPGGSVLDGAMIISAMEAAQGPVYTICNTICASMAAMIFEHGTERYIVDRSFVMFHPASGGMQGEVDKMASRVLSIQRFFGKMEAYVAKRANISFERYKQLSGVELWIDAEDAVNNGFADKIVSVVLPETIKIPVFGGDDRTNWLPGEGKPFITFDPTTKFNFSWKHLSL